MYKFAIVSWSVLLHVCNAQLKACYQAVDNEVSGDFPCNPDADISSCCSSGNVCSSNLYCVSASNQQNYVGTCTDKTWSSSACPFNLSSSQFVVPQSKNTEPLTIAASASGIFDPWYDKFNYTLNTTQCSDGTLCPFANNRGCCDENQGIKEVHYNYNSSAVMPKDVAELTTFYAAAGYIFPTAIPPPPTTLSSSTKLPIAVPTAIPPPTTTLSSSTKLPIAATPIPTTPSVPSPGLSHSDKIGLGISISLGVLVCSFCAIVLHLFILLRRRRRRQSDMPKELGSRVPTSIHGYSTELEGTPAESELEDSQQVHELYDDYARSLKS